MHVYEYTQVHVYMCVYIYIYIYICVSACVRTFVHIDYAHVNVRACVIALWIAVIVIPINYTIPINAIHCLHINSMMVGWVHVQILYLFQNQENYKTRNDVMPKQTYTILF